MPPPSPQSTSPPALPNSSLVFRIQSDAAVHDDLRAFAERTGTHDVRRGEAVREQADILAALHVEYPRMYTIAPWDPSSTKTPPNLATSVPASTPTTSMPKSQRWCRSATHAPVHLQTWRRRSANDPDELQVGRGAGVGDSVYDGLGNQRSIVHRPQDASGALERGAGELR